MSGKPKRGARRCAFEVLALLLLSLLLGLVTQTLHPRAPSWRITSKPLEKQEIALSEVDARFGGDVLWVDARTEEQFLAGHIPGALLINPQEAATQLFENFDSIRVETRPVVVYCADSSLSASREVAEYLRENTILKPIFVLHGAWPVWIEKGKSVE